MSSTYHITVLHPQPELHTDTAKLQSRANASAIGGDLLKINQFLQWNLADCWSDRQAVSVEVSDKEF